MEKLTEKDQRFLKWYEEVISDLKVVLDIKKGDEDTLDLLLILDLCLVRYENVSLWYSVEVIRSYIAAIKILKKGKVTKRKVH